MNPYREQDMPKQIPAKTLTPKAGWPIVIPKATVPAHSMMPIEIPVDVLFRTEQICLDPVSAVHFDIEGIYIDAQHVGDLHNGAPATVFASACVPQLKFPTCSPGQKIIIALRNIRSEERVFGGGILIGMSAT